MVTCLVHPHPGEGKEAERAGGTLVTGGSKGRMNFNAIVSRASSGQVCELARKVGLAIGCAERTQLCLTEFGWCDRR